MGDVGGTLKLIQIIFCCCTLECKEDFAPLPCKVISSITVYFFVETVLAENAVVSYFNNLVGDDILMLLAVLLRC